MCQLSASEHKGPQGLATWNDAASDYETATYFSPSGPDRPSPIKTPSDPTEHLNVVS